jgi:hypothetical protein
MIIDKLGGASAMLMQAWRCTRLALILTQNYYQNYSNNKLLGYSARFCDEWHRNKKCLVRMVPSIFIMLFVFALIKHDVELRRSRSRSAKL